MNHAGNDNQESKYGASCLLGDAYHKTKKLLVDGNYMMKCLDTFRVYSLRVCDVLSAVTTYGYGHIGCDAHLWTTLQT